VMRQQVVHILARLFVVIGLFACLFGPPAVRAASLPVGSNEKKKKKRKDYASSDRYRL